MIHDAESIELQDEEAVQIYEGPLGFWSSPRGLLVFGLGSLLLSLLLLVPAWHFQWGELGSVTISAFAALGLGKLISSPLALRKVRRVLVDDEGLVLESLREQSILRWNDLVHVEISTWGPPEDRAIWLYDRSGRQIAKLTGELEGFRTLSKRIQREVKKTRLGPADRIPPRRPQGMAVVMIVAGAALFGVAAQFAWGTRAFVHDAWRLATQGVAGEAVVTEHYTKRDGRAYWIAYELSLAPSEPVRRQVEVEEAFWRSLALGDAVAINYVPGAPQINALARGEAPFIDLAQWLLFLGLFTFGVVMGLAFFVAGVLHLARVEIKRKPGAWTFTLVRERLY